jgi:hypothetical protein
MLFLIEFEFYTLLIEHSTLNLIEMLETQKNMTRICKLTPYEHFQNTRKT